MSGEPTMLVCPGCSREHAGTERFCAHCGLPLVHPDLPVAVAPDPRRLQARKIKPQLAEGDLIRVVGARNQAEAEFIQGMLLEEGIPSLLRRSAGFDVPDMLAAGPRDILVPQSGALTARQVLLQAELVPTMLPEQARVNPVRLMTALLLALAIGTVLVWLATRHM